MDTAAVTAIVSGASAIGGALVATGGNAWHHRNEQRTRGRAELEARLTAFATAVDVLTTEVRDLPDQSRRSQLVGEWLERRMPTVDFFFGRLSRFLLGRKLWTAMAGFQEAGNRLTLGAPREVLVACGGIGDVLGRFAETPRDEFVQSMAKARADYAVVARLAVHGEFEKDRRLRRVLRTLRRDHAWDLPPAVRAALDDA